MKTLIAKYYQILLASMISSTINNENRTEKVGYPYSMLCG